MSRTSGLDALAQLAADDLVRVVDVSDTTMAATGTNKKVTVSALRGDGVVSVADYGAVGDGATDDSAAIQAAVDAVGAAGGGTVFFPSGTYLVGTTIDVDSNVTRLEGEGRTASVTNTIAPVVLKADTDFADPVIHASGTPLLGLEIEGFLIDLTDAASAAVGVQIEGAYRLRLARVYVDEIKADGYGFIIRPNASAGVFWGSYEHCIAQGDASLAAGSRVGTGWLIERDAGDNHWVNQQSFLHCEARAVNIGWDIQNPGAGMLWDNCQSELLNTSTGIGVRATTPYEIEVDLLWRGGEVNNCATAFDGPILAHNVTINSNVSTCLTNGAKWVLDDDDKRRTIYSSTSWTEKIERVAGAFGEGVGRSIWQRTTGIEASTPTTVLTIPGATANRGALGLVMVKAMRTGNYWEAQAYIAPLFFVGLPGAATEVLGTALIDAQAGAGGIAGWDVTLSNDGTNKTIQVEHTESGTIQVHACFVGLGMG